MDYKNNDIIDIKFIVSIVISTYNRPNNLLKLINSILRQSVNPYEIIIVNDGEEQAVKNVIKDISERLSLNNINLSYYKNMERNSNARCRNIGLNHVKGEIILFLDDDIILDSNYIKEIINFYNDHPDAGGVQGIMMNVKVSSHLLNSINKIFLLNNNQINKCILLPSGYLVYPYPNLDKDIRCEYLRGCVQCYRRSCIKDRRFNGKLERLSSWEDIEFSNYFNKNSNYNLYLTPRAKYSHDYTAESTMNQKTFLYCLTIYGYYFFYRNIEQTIINKLMFGWRLFGDLVIRFIFFINDLFRKEITYIFKLRYLKEIIILLESYVYLLKNIKKIQNNEIEFFNEMLYSDMDEIN